MELKDTPPLQEGKAVHVDHDTLLFRNRSTIRPIDGSAG
jgi:hypothetical protein